MPETREVTLSTDGGLRTVSQAGELTTVMDEPVESGGTGTGPTPMQTLLAALGGCTAITLKLYSARKSWPLEDVDVKVVLELPDRREKDAGYRIVQSVTLKGPLDEGQRERLMQIAGRCPVHRVMEGPVQFEEREA